jgi:hypothetical protein
MSDKKTLQQTDAEAAARSLGRWENEGGAKAKQVSRSSKKPSGTPIARQNDRK